MKFYKKIIAAILLCILIVQLVGCDQNKPYTVSKFPAFGSEGNYYYMDASLYGKNAEQAADKMKEELRLINSTLSATVEGSDIYQFNQLPKDTELKVSKMTYDLVVLSKEMSEYTEGYFNPAVYPLCKLWGLRDIVLFSPPQGFSLPSIEAVNQTLAYCTMDNVEAIERENEYYLIKRKDDRVQIELGSVAKGYAADRCRDIMEEYSLIGGFVNLSGNTYFYKGKGKDQVDWITLLTVTDETGFFCRLKVQDTSVVASSDFQIFYYYRYEGESDSLTVPHIIDPHTGIPMGLSFDEQSGRYYERQSQVSATVIGASSVLCDIFTTAAILMPYEQAIAFMDEQEGFASIIINTDRQYALTGDVRIAESLLGERYGEYELTHGQFIKD